MNDTIKLSEMFQFRFPSKLTHPDMTAGQGLYELSDPTNNFVMWIPHIKRGTFHHGGTFKNLSRSETGTVVNMEIDIPPSVLRTDEDPKECVNIVLQRIEGVVQAFIGPHRVNFIVQDEYDYLPVHKSLVLFNVMNPANYVDGPVARAPHLTVAFKMQADNDQVTVEKYHN
jgi:hypothetical protein